MTTIEWTHREGTKGESWNPVTGCTRVSPGCEICYAETLSHRLNAMGQPKYRGVTKNSGKWSGKVLLHEEVLEVPFRWKKPRTVFVCSMSDLFHEEVPDEFIAKVLAVIGLCGERWHYRNEEDDDPKRLEPHTFLVLTKRPERMAEMFRDDRHIDAQGTDWKPHIKMLIEEALGEMGYGGESIDMVLGREWPWKHLWLGTSIESPEHIERAHHIMEVPAEVRFLSLEPLLAPINLKGLLFAPPKGLEPREWRGINWVIAGGESGPGARACHLDWLRSIRDQCAAAGVPFFLKQLGADPWDARVLKEGSLPSGMVTVIAPAPLDDGLGRKKRSGTDALLDGELHHEWPLVTQEAG